MISVEVFGRVFPKPRYGGSALHSSHFELRVELRVSMQAAKSQDCLKYDLTELTRYIPTAIGRREKFAFTKEMIVIRLLKAIQLCMTDY